jgi:hypothetical protein
LSKFSSKRPLLISLRVINPDEDEDCSGLDVLSMVPLKKIHPCLYEMEADSVTPGDDVTLFTWNDVNSLNLTLKAYPNIFVQELDPILSQVVKETPWITTVSFLVP